MLSTENFNPTLAYLFRRQLAGLLLEDLPGGSFLEIGVGRGLFYCDLIKRKFSGVCLDLNPVLIEMHRKLSLIPSGVEFLAGDFASLSGQVDLLVAFEVLEHYDRDLECLRQWRERLNPGGVLLFSVPAHMRHWTINDTRAGHVRRYEKSDLQQKLESEKFKILEFWSYGGPILIWTYRLSSLLKKIQPESRVFREYRPPIMISDSKLRPLHFEETSSSGTQSFSFLSRRIFCEGIWRPFLQIQKRHLRGDDGIGYIIKCRMQD